MTIDGMTVMVPVHTAPAFASPYFVEKPDDLGRSRVGRGGVVLGEVASFPVRPRFYDLSTADGIPYWQIAVLHGRNVLATTVLQTCIRYQSRAKTCQFCAIGQSLAAGRTIERKTMAQLAEVAMAAVVLDGVSQMVMTTGTPPGRDRGAAILAESAAAVKAAVALPIQGQCEPPDEDAWFARMKAAGIDALGMHLEAVAPEVRTRIMPGKAQVSLDRYFAAFAAAVRGVRARAGVDLHLGRPRRHHGGDPRDGREGDRARGLPFVVPFVPISGTPLERIRHLRPRSCMTSYTRSPRCCVQPACGRPTSRPAAAGAGACSALSTYERGTNQGAIA